MATQKEILLKFLTGQQSKFNNQQFMADGGPINDPKLESQNESNITLTPTQESYANYMFDKYGKVLLTDKNTNQTIYGTKKPDGSWDLNSFEVLSGANGNKGRMTNLTLGEIESHSAKDQFQFKITPLGEYNIRELFGDKEYNGSTIENIGTNGVNYHETYDRRVRDHFYNNGNPFDNKASYGCINCQKPSMDQLRNFIDKNTVSMIIDSNMSIKENDKIMELNNADALKNMYNDRSIKDADKLRYRNNINRVLVDKINSIESTLPSIPMSIPENLEHYKEKTNDREEIFVDKMKSIKARPTAINKQLEIERLKNTDENKKIIIDKDQIASSDDYNYNDREIPRQGLPNGIIDADYKPIASNKLNMESSDDYDDTKKSLEKQILESKINQHAIPSETPTIASNIVGPIRTRRSVIEPEIKDDDYGDQPELSKPVLPMIAKYGGLQKFTGGGITNHLMNEYSGYNPGYSQVDVTNHNMLSNMNFDGSFEDAKKSWGNVFHNGSFEEKGFNMPIKDLGIALKDTINSGAVNKGLLTANMMSDPRSMMWALPNKGALGKLKAFTGLASGLSGAALGYKKLFAGDKTDRYTEEVPISSFQTNSGQTINKPILDNPTMKLSSEEITEKQRFSNENIIPGNGPSIDFSSTQPLGGYKEPKYGEEPLPMSTTNEQDPNPYNSSWQNDPKFRQWYVENSSNNNSGDINKMYNQYLGNNKQYGGLQKFLPGGPVGNEDFPSMSKPDPYNSAWQNNPEFKKWYYQNSMNPNAGDINKMYQMYTGNNNQNQQNNQSNNGLWDVTSRSDKGVNTQQPVPFTTPPKQSFFNRLFQNSTNNGGPSFTPSNRDPKNTITQRRDGYGQVVANNALAGFGMFNEVMSQEDYAKQYEKMLRDTGNTDNMKSNNPVNPFGNYTLNAGPASNFALVTNGHQQDFGTKMNMAEYGGQNQYEQGGQYQVSDEEIERLRSLGYEFDLLD